MKKYLLIFLFSFNCQAGDLMLGQLTYHFDEYLNQNDCLPKGPNICEYYNDSQELIGYAGDKYAIVYMHQNSLYEKSLVVTRLFKYKYNDYITPYAANGIATGYQRLRHQNYKGVTIVGYLGLDIHPKHNKFGLLITWLPESFIGIGTRVKF